MTSESEYAAAVWRWLRCESIIEPDPRVYQVDENIAAAIRRQCEIERKSRRQPVGHTAGVERVDDRED